MGGFYAVFPFSARFFNSFVEVHTKRQARKTGDLFESVPGGFLHCYQQHFPLFFTFFPSLRSKPVCNASTETTEEQKETEVEARIYLCGYFSVCSKKALFSYKRTLMLSNSLNLLTLPK